MQIVTNQKYIDNRVRFARWGSIIGFGLLIVAPVMSIVYGSEMFTVEYAALILGFMTFSYARSYAFKFELRPTESEVLANSLKGLDYKYRLYNYSSDAVEAQHFLLSPYGIFVMETRHQWGDIRNSGDRWKHKKGAWEWLRTIAVGPVGNPTRDAEKGVQAVRTYLEEKIGVEQANQVPIDGIIVFTNPKAELTLEDPAVPVIAPAELKRYVRPAQEQPQVGAAKVSGSGARVVGSNVQKGQEQPAEGREKRVSPALQKSVAAAFGMPETSSAKQ